MTAAIKAQDVKALRDITGTGMMDSKRALEGTVQVYVHHDRQLGVLVELNSESDFVARTEGFQHLAHEIALHVAASSPQYVRRDDVPAELIEQMRADFHKQATLL